MFSKLMVIILGWFVFVSPTPMTIYKNAQFYATDIRSLLTALFSVTTQNSCICQCYANASCITGTFFGFNQTRILSSAYLQQGRLSLMTTNNFASVFSFPNKTVSSVPCHLCTSSSYTGTCLLMVFSNANCTISGQCKTATGVLKPANITLTPGSGNGCALANSNGTLKCGSFCN